MALKVKRIIIIVIGLLVLATAGASFWFVRHSQDFVVDPKITEERRVELETELKTALDKVSSADKNIDNYLVAGRIHQMLGQLSEAERFYKKALKINRTDSLVYQDLGILYEEEEKYSEADKMLRIATEINPYDARGFELLIDLYFEHFPDKSEELKTIFRAASDFTASPDIWARYGKFLEDRREYREALIYYQEALDKRSEDVNLQEAVERVSKILEGKQ